MTDDGVSAGGSFKLPFTFRDHPATIAIGGSFDQRTRETYTRRFRYVPAPGAVLDADFRAQEPNDLFRPANIGPAGFTIQEATFRTDNYDAEETVSAGFAKIDMEILPRVKLSGGARIESTDQVVSPRDFWDSGLPGLEGADATSSDLLPAVNLTYEVTERMNLRASASRTLARPQLRELAPFAFADYAGGYLVSGNPRLTRTLVENFDLRWEWFTTPRSVIAVSGFYKKFDEPLEALVLPSTELIKSWVNADGATNYGVELEARSDLAFLAPALADVSFNGNLTLVTSEVQTGRLARIYIAGEGNVDLQVVDRDRGLQGQSPYVANLGLTWFNPTSGMSASVLFNRFGRRIDAVGSQGTPDIYEEARSQLDVVVEAPLLRGWTAKLSAGRLLGSEVEFRQGGDVLRAWDQGRTLSFGLSWGSGR
jgi:TonB-dependent receptor